MMMMMMMRRMQDKASLPTLGGHGHLNLQLAEADLNTSISLVQNFFFLDLRSDLRICFSVGQN